MATSTIRGTGLCLRAPTLPLNHAARSAVIGTGITGLGATIDAVALTAEAGWGNPFVILVLTVPVAIGWAYPFRSPGNDDRIRHAMGRARGGRDSRPRRRRNACNLLETPSLAATPTTQERSAIVPTWAAAVPKRQSHRARSRALRAELGRGVMSRPAGEGLPPVLLTMANYNGTLAAVRALGAAGVGVTTADSSRLAVSAWSKFTTKREKCPDVRDPDRFIGWLLEFGRTRGRHVLLPTSDDTAWLYALHRESLSRYFYLSSPSIDVVYRLLNKRSLYEEATNAGLDVPRTWFPQSADDLAQCANEARFPVMVKPQTQVLFETRSKGVFIESAEQLAPRYSKFSRQTYVHKLLDIDPSAARPMVQEFYLDAAKGIYNISAYVHRGRLCGARAARKLLQQPRRLGIGVCFEEAPIIPELADGLERLVARVGFSGVFEAEFINTADTSVLIDFNPRFYNQMGFDIARGLPLPTMAYCDALGLHAQLDETCDTLTRRDEQTGRVFVDLFSLRTLLFLQRMSGALSADEQRCWTDWYERHRDNCTYAYRDTSDRVPAWLAMFQLAARHGRHPRNFITSMVLNRT